jgi:methyl-accepting chemotaxis protein
MPHTIPDWVFIALIVATGVGVLIQAGVLVGMLVVLLGAMKRFDHLSKKADEVIIPVLESTRDLLKDVSPKLKLTTQNLVEMSQTAKEVGNTARTESAQVAVMVNDLLARTAVQVDRVDEMVTGTLNSVAHATATMQKAVSGPVRQVGAVLSGLRAGIEALRRKEPETASVETENEYHVHAAADSHDGEPLI